MGCIRHTLLHGNTFPQVSHSSVSRTNNICTQRQCVECSSASVKSSCCCDRPRRAAPLRCGSDTPAPFPGSPLGRGSVVSRDRGLCRNRHYLFLDNFPLWSSRRIVNGLVDIVVTFRLIFRQRSIASAADVGRRTSVADVVAAAAAAACCL